jgi:hypothetical protein
MNKRAANPTGPALPIATTVHSADGLLPAPGPSRRDGKTLTPCNFNTRAGGCDSTLPPSR